MSDILSQVTEFLVPDFSKTFCWVIICKATTRHLHLVEIIVEQKTKKQERMVFITSLEICLLQC